MYFENQKISCSKEKYLYEIKVYDVLKEEILAKEKQERKDKKKTKTKNKLKKGERKK